jgi:hypothetical protein
MKAQRTSAWEKATSSILNFALFALIFFDIFSDFVSVKEAQQFLAQLDRRCGL